MADQRKMIVLFGASGFTGGYIARRLLELERGQYAVVLAGRSADRVRTAVGRDALEARPDVRVVEADAGSGASLGALLRPAASHSGAVLIAAAGPFLEMGLPVARACAEHGVHYVDICGEPLFYLQLVEHVGALASSAGVAVVPGCGFDCLPSQLALRLLRRAHPSASSVDAFLSLRGPTLSANLATLRSAVRGVRLRSAASAALSRLSLPRPPPRGPRRPPLSLLPFSAPPPARGWATPFLGADNAMQALSDRLELALPQSQSEVLSLAGPPRCRLFWAFPSLLALFGWFWIVFVVALAALLPPVERLLFRAPALFPLGLFRDLPSSPPSAASLASSSFHWLLLASDDASAPVATFSASGPEPGYVATSGMVLSAALSLLHDPSVPSGVLTPALAFDRPLSSIRSRMESMGVLFITQES